MNRHEAVADPLRAGGDIGGMGQAARISRPGGQPRRVRGLALTPVASTGQTASREPGQINMTTTAPSSNPGARSARCCYTRPGVTLRPTTRRRHRAGFVARIAGIAKDQCQPRPHLPAVAVSYLPLRTLCCFPSPGRRRRDCCDPAT